MTYEEAYRNCKTLTELEEMVRHDVSVAMMLNPDRASVIKETCEKVANEKFKKRSNN